MNQRLLSTSTLAFLSLVATAITGACGPSEPGPRPAAVASAVHCRDRVLCPELPPDSPCYCDECGRVECPPFRSATFCEPPVEGCPGGTSWDYALCNCHRTDGVCTGPYADYCGPTQSCACCEPPTYQVCHCVVDLCEAS